MTDERKGKIQTVLGLIHPSDLGCTLTHEHLMVQVDDFFIPPFSHNDVSKTEIPFTLENLGWIRQNPYSHKPNLTFVKEEDVILEEMKAYSNLGGKAVVENTTIGLHRDISFLNQLSRESNIHIVSGTGFYVEKFQKESTKHLSEEAMAAQMREDICSGADGTDIHCGVIGEIGCSWPLTDFEKRSLRSGAALQFELGSPAIIHPGRNPEAPFEIMRIFLEEGASANKTVMSHLERTIFDDELLLEFAKFGCYCEYDLFGIETSHYQLSLDNDMPSDAQRIAFIRSLIENGYSDRVLIAHDIHTKHRLKRYGGHGYTHILENVVPKMKQRGISEEEIKCILTDNPAAWLTFTK